MFNFSGNQKFHTNSQTVNFANYKIINSFSKLKTEQSQNDESSDKGDLEEDKPEITNVNDITENRIELDYNLKLPESENKNVPENEKSTKIPEKELNRFQDIRETLHTNEIITNEHITDTNEEMETLHTNEMITNEPITDTNEETETFHTNEIITNELVTNEEMEIINNETDSTCDIRFAISERLPSLVGYNLSSFNDICTKGCDWSPSGEKLLVAAEDARKDFFSWTCNSVIVLFCICFPFQRQTLHKYFSNISQEIKTKLISSFCAAIMLI